MKTRNKRFAALLAIALSLGLATSAWAASFEQAIEFEGTELAVTGDVDANGVVTIEKVMSDGADVTADYADNADLAAALSPLVYDVNAARSEAFGIGEAGSTAAPEGESPEGESPEGESPEGESPEGESPEGEVPEGEVPEGEVPEGEVPEGEETPQE